MLGLVAALGLVGAAAGDDVEVVRVPVPAKDVAKVFPPGTELRVLALREFEALVREARRGMAEGAATGAPRLIRARHRARWDAGRLVGRSELIIAPFAAGPAEFPLAPWTPAILEGEGGKLGVGARDSGVAVLRLEGSNREKTIRLDWELQPRPHSRGRGFAMGLPAEGTTVLELELPHGWTASSQRGVRRGPIAVPGAPLDLWELDGEAGQFDVELRDARDRERTDPGAGAWFHGTTEIDLRRDAGLSATMVNWTAEDQVELDPRHPGRFSVELDPGLELIDVQGPAVRGYRIERLGRGQAVTTRTNQGTRVAVTLAEGVRTASLKFLAHARVPPEGRWSVPSLHPVDATWTGGRTTVVLDDLRAVRKCRERAGRLVPSAPGESDGDNRLTFEEEAPRSVAELEFIRPGMQVACTVLGRLVLGSGGPPRLDCRVDWVLQRGSISQMEVDLSPAWLPDQVRILGLDDPLPWHSSALPTGATRLRVMIPASALERGRGTLSIGATSTVAAGRGPLELPRVRPRSAAIVDEAWLAWVDDGTTIQPTSAQGLAWIDTRDVPGLAAMTPPAPGLREAIAWRWTGDRAEARVDRERIDQDPRASIRTRAQLSPDGRTLKLEGTILIGSGAAPLDALPIWVEGPGDTLASWHFSAEDGVELRPRPIGTSARARLSLPDAASARELLLKLPALGEKAVHFHAERPWSFSGDIPLLFVPRDYLKGGTVMVETPAGMKARPHAVGLGRLDPSSADRPPGESGTGASIWTSAGAAAGRSVQAFSYPEPGARLELTTESLEPAPITGVVRDALLTTWVDPRGRTLNRLCLAAELDGAASLALDLPDGAIPVRVRRDGADVVPIHAGRRIAIPSATAGATAGIRPGTIVLDYLVETDAIGDGDPIRPALPRLDVPCLSFTWEVVAPAGWRTLDPGAGLVADDPDAAYGWPLAALGLSLLHWPTLGMRGWDDGHDGLGTIMLLDSEVHQPGPPPRTLAEWFGRWEASPWPIVVDRLALESAGLGPRTPRVEDRTSSTSLMDLRRQGLTAVMIGDALVITTEAERSRFARTSPWRDAIGEALAWGRDRSDRFQTVERWRGEVTTGGSGHDGAEGYRSPPGRLVRRFSATEWPDDRAFVHMVDGRRGVAVAWAVAASLTLAWLGLVALGRREGRRLRPGWRLAFLVAAAVVFLSLERLLPARQGSALAGGFVAALTLLIVELSRRIPRAEAAPTDASRRGSSLLRGTARATASPGLILLPIVAFLTGASMAAPRQTPRAGGGPIVALFPYEGTFDPSRLSERVILRLDDYQRLVHLAGAARAHAPSGSVIAVSATHRVARSVGPEVSVDSEIELLARGPGPFGWSVPVASAREITAEVDGRPAPIAVDPSGARARLTISGAGAHRLRLRRWAGVRAEEAGVESIRLPVGALPTARLVLAPPRAGIPQGTADARGRLESAADGSLVGRLGPAGRIVVRWERPGLPASAARNAGPVDGLLLWDVTPAGDRLRERLTYHHGEEIAAVWLWHDADLALRSVRAPGSARVYCEDDTESHQWLLSFDPPLPPTSTIALECWRPASPEPARPTPAGAATVGANPAASRPAGARATTPDRWLPVVRPAGAERFTGLLGVRRPGDWTGRLAPIPDTAPAGDETFVEAWGPLPEEPLTLCGTSRFSRGVEITLRTAPAPARVSIRPAETIRIEAGRLVLSVEADIQDLANHPPILEARLPRGLRLTEISGEGLVDWAVSADRRLHLTWRRRGPGWRRHLHIAGWIPLQEDPLRIGPRLHRVRTPWVGWPGAEPGPGTLVVLSSTRASLVGASGLSQDPAATTAPLAAPGPSSGSGSGSGGSPTAIGQGTAAAASPSRLAFQVNDPARLGELSWESRPPRVAVIVQSQLTIHPDFAEWVAVLRYDVAGGALDRINLRLPTAWAARTRLRLSGEELQHTTQSVEPSAFWSITPPRPLWGSRRFVLRSTLPLGAAREVAFPDIAPLGWGRVDTHLALVNATGAPLGAVEATGLRAISPPFAFRDRELTRDAGTPAGAYQVREEQWSMQVPLPHAGAGGELSGSQDDAARIALADVLLTVLPDRSTIGRAIYDIAPNGGRVLTVGMPAGSSILWAADEPHPVVPLRAGPDAWSITLTPGRQNRVCLIWKSPAPTSAGRAGAAWPLALPRAGVGECATLVTLSTPAGVAVEGLPAGFEPATMARLALVRAERQARSIREIVARPDRASARVRDRLVGLLIQFELNLRAASRSARHDATAASPPAAAREILAKVAESRADVIQAVRSADLADLAASARAYLGPEQRDEGSEPESEPEPAAAGGARPRGAIAEPVPPCRIRGFGRPLALLGSVKGPDDPSAVRPALTLVVQRAWWSPAAAAVSASGVRRLSMAVALIGAAILATALGSRRTAGATALVLVLSVAGFSGGPVALAGGLGLVAASRRAARSSA